MIDQHEIDRKRTLTERQRAWKAAHPEYQAEWRRKNRGRVVAYNKKWREQYPERAKESAKRSYYRSIFKMELEDLQTIIEVQNGVCPICSVELVLDGKNGAHVDHDHKTGLIRGVLCCNCNVGLGKFKDNPESLIAAVEYLQREENTL